MVKKKLLKIGISGVTCGGKTTLATKLHQLLQPNCQMVSQDDYFRAVDDPHHVWIPELNHINYDILSSLDMDKMYKDLMDKIASFDQIESKINSVLNGETAQSNGNLQTTAKQSLQMRNDVQVLIIEGFSIFNYRPLVPLFHLKYYFTLNKSECLKRREQRVYDPPDCPGYFEFCAWPEHLKQLEEVKNDVENVNFFDEGITMDQCLDFVLKDVVHILK